MWRFLFLGLWIWASATAAFAQSSPPVWSTDYESPAIQNNQAVTSNSYPSVANVPPPPQPKYNSAVPRKSVVIKRGGGNADAAWQRQWGPIQDITGISSGQARDFVQGVKQRYAEGTQKTLASAQDWAVILGDSGLIGTVTDSTSLWFNYVASDIPAAVGNNGGLMGGLHGFGAFPAMNSGE